jgi:hypothetical protein
MLSRQCTVSVDVDQPLIDGVDYVRTQLNILHLYLCIEGLDGLL